MHLFLNRFSVLRNLAALAFALIATSVFALPQDVDFETQVKPIFEKHCISCHCEEKEEGTRLDIADDAMDYISPEDAENSDLYMHLLGEDLDIMPPEEEEDPLTPEQIETIKNWIDAGAEWPEGMTLAVAVEETAEEAPAEGEAVQADDTIYRAIGALHPAALHMPIGLLVAAGFFALLSLRGNFVMSDCAYYCLWLGTFGAIIACVTGWWFCENENRDVVVEFGDVLDQTHDIFWHRTTAIISTAVALLLALFAAAARAKDPEDGVVWKLGCILLAAGIGYTGHLGGELTHGKDLYDPIEKLWGQVNAPEEPGAADAGDESGDGEVGEASGDDGEGGSSDEGGAGEENAGDEAGGSGEPNRGANFG
ncbi:MAG: DUF2231 domain-containing protein [Planctomycetota bacterium]